MKHRRSLLKEKIGKQRYFHVYLYLSDPLQYRVRLIANGRLRTDAVSGRTHEKTEFIYFFM